MNRYAIENLFGIEGFSISWYGIIIGIGMALGVIFAAYRAKKKGYDPEIMYDMAFIAVPLAIVGARIYYVIFEWDLYKNDLLTIFNTRLGGLAIYGGVIGGILGVFIFSKWKKIPFFVLMDIAIPSLILGQAIGRWGNFFNQEAFGNIVTNPDLQFFPYAVYIDQLQEWHQATFFYECVWNICLLILILLIEKRLSQPGMVLSCYMIGYGTGRTLIEGLRTDSLYWGDFRVSKVLSMLLIVAGILLFLYLAKFQSGRNIKNRRKSK
ncbi:MAG: prolipoprotein diacylglyceryl transferase [Lachnospiraceae bacterium]